MAAVFGLALLTLVACSGGGSDELTPAEAAALAEAGLLEEADLPAANWEQQESQTGLAGLVPDSAGDVDLDLLPDACGILEDVISDVPSVLADANPLASASRSFSATGTLLNLDSVSSTVVAFETAEGAEAAADLIEEAFQVDTLEGCVQQAITPAGDSGVRITGFSFTTPGYALQDSTALAVSIDAVALVIPISLSLDLHAFQRGNALALYVAVSVNSSNLDGEHAGLLTTFANRLDAAQ